MALGLHATPCAKPKSVDTAFHEVGVSLVEYAMHGLPNVLDDPATTHFTSPLVEVGSYATPLPLMPELLTAVQLIPSFE